MDKETARTLVQRIVDDELKERIDARMAEHCTVTPDGERIRGYVSKVKCHGCGHERWDDGTPCRQPGRYGNKYCGHRNQEGLERMEDGREG